MPAMPAAMPTAPSPKPTAPCRVPKRTATSRKASWKNLGLALKRHEEEAMSARQRLAEAEKGVADLGDLDAARTQVEEVKMAVEAARMTMMSKRSAHDELRREGEARTRRLSGNHQRDFGWKHRLETAGKRIAELDERKTENEAELKDAQAAPDELAAKRDELADAIGEAETRRKASSDKLAEGETAEREAANAERDAERAAGEAREARARAEARADAARETVALAAERIQEEMETTPDALLETLDADPEKMPSSEQIEHDVNRLKRQRDSLGAVNLRAEEDAKEVQEEHDNLLSEKTDLEEAIKALRTGHFEPKQGMPRTSVNRIRAGDESFGTLFKHLFGGGEAKLVLVESDDPLDAGLEIMCQPPGKKLSTLSLLSGGEQTLTALALIFAVFLANPAPICVLDEVDARWTTLT